MLCPFENLVVLATLFTTVTGHARVTIPKTRETGPQHRAICGEAFVKKLENDKASPIESALPALPSTPTQCTPFLCRSYIFSDTPTSSIQHLSPSTTLAFHVDVIAGHRPGYANVSIVDTQTNRVLSELKSWENWPCYKVGSTGDGVGECGDDRDFNVTMPSKIDGKCATAGNCVIQWYWYATANKQTYESCVDFVVV